MLNFDWLNQLRAGRRSRRRYGKTGRQPLPQATEQLQVRTMLSGMAITAEAGAGDQDQVTHMTGTGDHHPDSGHMQMEAAAGSGQSGGMHGGMHGGVMKLAPAEGASHTVVVSGDWSDSSVWQNGTLPTDGADVYIPAGLILTVDGIIAETLHTIRIDGTLRFNTDVDTEIRVDTVLGSVDSRFEMGTANTPIADGVTARVTVADTGEIDRAWDPFGFSRGVLLQGSSSIHGAAMTSWATLNTAPLAGDTTLTLTTVPDNWKVGDSLVIAGTDADTTGDETVTISGLNGTLVSLDQTLQRDHLPPRAEFQIHVANTTRNAVIESENPALDRRGHVMFMHNRDVSVAFGGFYELGRSNKMEAPNDAELDENGLLREGTGTNVVGRYSVHFHRNGVQAGDGPATVTGSAIVGSPGWGFVNHSSYVEITDNVAHNVSGAAFVTEAGDEIGSFIGNLSIRTHGTGDHPTERADDFGHAGDGFWFQGAGVSIENNVATGATGSGLILYNDALSQPEGQRIEFLAENLPDPSVAGDAETVPVTLVPVRSFKGNTAYGSELGAQVYYHRTLIQVDTDQLDIAQSLQGTVADSVLEDMTIWNSVEGFSASYALDTIFRNFTIVNPHDEPGHVGFDASNAYNRAGHMYENLEIEGFETGLIPSSNGQVVINGGQFNNAQDIVIQEPRQTHRRMEINGDIQFGDLSGLQIDGDFVARQNIVMDADLRSAPDSAEEWYLLNDRVILNFGDHNGEQLFFAEQATDQVLYTGQPGQLNSDDPGLEVNPDHFGLTNAQLQDMFGSSFGGVLTTEDAVDMVDDGIIGPIGVAASDPGLLPDPDDPFVATPQGREDLFDAIAELQTLTQAEVDVLYASENAPEPHEVALIESLRAMSDVKVVAYVEEAEGLDIHRALQAIESLFDAENDDDEPGDEDGDTSDEEEDDDFGPDDDEEEADEDDPGSDDDDFGPDDDEGECEEDEESGPDEDDGAEDDSHILVAEGVEYGRGQLDGDSTPLTLDLYQPSSESESPRPLIVMIHGGGFIAGSSADMADHAHQMAERGYVVASISYRLNASEGDAAEPFLTMAEEGLAAVNPGEVPPASAVAAAMEDAARALNWLSDNAGAFGIDNSRIAIWGESAGAATALQSAYALDDYGVDVPQISAVVSHAGALGLDSLMEEGEASLFIVHGTDDETVPYIEAQQLQAQAQSVGISIELKAIEGAGHDVTMDQEVDGVTLFDSAASFLDTVLDHNTEHQEDDESEDVDGEANDLDNDALPPLESPQGAFTLTLSEYGDDIDIVIAGSELRVLSGEAATRHVDLSSVTSLTIEGSVSADFVLLDLEEASSLELESIIVNGGAGSDWIQVQGYREEIATTLTVNGDDGNDVVLVAASRSAVNLNGGDGDDRLDGGQGADNIDGGQGNDILLGRGGNDVLSGGDGNDRLKGHGGRDVLRGDDGNDVLKGGGGDDFLLGGDGRDRMRGQGGDDTMIGGDGADILKGGSGNDAVEFGTDDDIKQGGRGIDALITSNGSGREFAVLGQIITSNDFASVTSNSDGEEENPGPSAEDIDNIDLGFESVADWFDTI